MKSFPVSFELADGNACRAAPILRKVKVQFQGHRKTSVTKRNEPLEPGSKRLWDSHYGNRAGMCKVIHFGVNLSDNDLLRPHGRPM